MANPMLEGAANPMLATTNPMLEGMPAPEPFGVSSMFQDVAKAAERAQMNKEIRMGLAIERTEAKHKALKKATVKALGPLAPPGEASGALEVLGESQARRISPPWRKPEHMTEIAPKVVPGTARRQFDVQPLFKTLAPTPEQAAEAQVKGAPHERQQPGRGMFPGMQPGRPAQLKADPQDPKSVLGKADLLLWALPRAATGLGAGVQEAAREMVKAPSPEMAQKAKEHIAERGWRSFTGEVPVSAGDVFETAYRAAKGGTEGGQWEQRDESGRYVHGLGPGEQVFVHGLGLATELWYGGRILKTLRPMPTRPAGPIIGQQMRKALVKAGAKPGTVEEFERLGQFVAQSHIHPKRLMDGRRYVRRLARKYGADEGAAEAWFIKTVGSQGEALGKGGLEGFLGRRYAKAQQKKVAPVLEELVAVEQAIQAEKLVQAGKIPGAPKVAPGAAPRGPIQQPAGKPTVLDSDSFPGMTYAEDVRMSGTLSSDMALAGAKGQEAVWYVARSRNYDEFLARFKEMGLKQDYLRVFRERFGIKPGWTRASHIKRMSGKAASMSEGEIQSVIDASEKSLAGKDFLSASRVARGARGPIEVAPGLGREGAGLPVAGKMPGLMRRKEALRTKAQPVPPGAEYSGPIPDELRRAAGEFQYKAGKPAGFVDVMRVPQSYEMTQMFKAEKGGRHLRKGLGKLDEPIGRHIDVKASLEAEAAEAAPLVANREALIAAGGDSVLADIEALDVQIAAKRAGAERALERAGMTREEALAPLKYAEGEQRPFGLGDRGEMQKKIVNSARLQQRQWRQKEIVDGVGGEEINNYVQRFEDLATKERRVKGITIGTEGAGKAAEDFNKHRAGIEKALGPESEVKRVEEFSKRWANRRRAHGLADSTAMMTNDAVKYYGKPVPNAWLNPEAAGRRLKGEPITTHDIRMEFHDLMNARGLTVTDIKIGNFKGQAVVMDREAARLLKRLADPGKVSEALRVAESISNWWRARATIFRTGFVVRNVIGNTLQWWQADVALKDIPKRYAQAAQIVWARALRSPVGYQKEIRDGLEMMFGRELFTKGGKMAKIEGRTVGEWIDAMERHKQFRSSFMAQEVGGAGPMRPMGGGLPMREWPGKWKAGAKTRWEAAKQGKLREAAFGPPRKGKVADVLLKGRVSPFSQNFAWMPANKAFNMGAEEIAHAGLFIDRVAKGFADWEAMGAVGKHLYFYDELSGLARAARSGSSFLTWFWKTWGRQTADLVLKPDRAAMFMRTFRGTEELDPLTEQEEVYEAAMDPSDREYKMNWRVPFVRGEPRERVERIGRHTSRRYERPRKHVMWAGVAPQAAVQQMDPTQPKKMAAEFAGILHPAFYIPELLLKKAEQEQTYPGFWGTYSGTRKAPLRSAPQWAGPLMDRAKSLGVDSLVGGLLSLEAVKEDYVANLVVAYKRGIRDPDKMHEYAEKKSRTMGYKWPAMFPEALTKIDPAFGTINRLLRATDEKTYDAVIATMLGFKPREYGLEESMVDYERQVTRALKELGVNTKKQLQLNKRIDKTNPFRHHFQ